MRYRIFVTDLSILANLSYLDNSRNGCKTIFLSVRVSCEVVNASDRFYINTFLNLVILNNHFDREANSKVPLLDKLVLADCCLFGTLTWYGCSSMLVLWPPTMRPSSSKWPIFELVFRRDWRFRANYRLVSMNLTLYTKQQPERL